MRYAPELLSTFVTQAGKIERPVSTEGWARPMSVEVSDGNLVFDYSDPPQRVKPGVGMMKGFLELADASDERIAAYARRWGALGRSPVDSDSGEFLKSADEGFRQTLPNIWELTYGRNESLALWRALSREVQDLLSQAARLDGILERPARKNTSREEKVQISTLGRDIQARMNRMVSAYSVRPYICWSCEKWSIRIHFDNLGGAIFLTLMLMIAKKDGLALCGSCGAPFETDGKRKKYCKSCGEAAAQCAASKKLYRAKSAARLKHQQGESVQQIAEALGRSVSRVKGWLEPGGAK